MSLLGQRIEPFAAMIFNRGRCGSLKDVVAPPYDLIDAKRQDELYARSPYNVVRLELNREPDPYDAAAVTLRQWIADRVVERAARPAIYSYTQKFELEGRRLTRHGLIARIRLEEFAAGHVLPHERTFPKAKEDRLRLLTATRTNISPIFGLCPSGDAALAGLLAKVAARPALIEVTDEMGNANEVREIGPPQEIAIVQRAFANSRILIADGHHRYETALEYRRRRRSAEGNPDSVEPYDYVMMTLVAFDDPGLVILPTHRVIRDLPVDAIASFEARARENFDVDSYDDPGALCSELAAQGRGALAVALRGDRALRILRLRNYEALAAAIPDAASEVRGLDVSILHALVLDRIFGIKPEAVRAGGNIEYTIDSRGALAAVTSGIAAGAFLMNPPTVHDVERVSGAGATMPEKSTYFHPKLLTGLVMNPLD
ncbi:MAG TPA: DUF1015 domain-containing protein [Candidatus Binataceae bacterium]|nr:DUF1015 domain-containing protein [Candidatus Binataceae bacterium]